MQTTFIPAALFDNLVSGLAKRLNDGLTPDMVSGQFEPHQIADLIAGYGIAPEDVAKQIIDDMCDTATAQLMEGVPAIARPAA